MRSKVKPATGWQRPLAFPIRLRDGHVIETLAQAVALTQQLPKQRQLKPVWPVRCHVPVARRRGPDSSQLRKLSKRALVATIAA
jgi:hypothetical protein